MATTEATQKVAVITGGASGMGLAVAQALASRGGWQIHVLDIKEDEGTRAASALPDTSFHRTDLTKYDDITAAFKTAFASGGGRLDLVFANAGIFEQSNVYDVTSTSLDLPPEPNYATVEVNLKGCINTIHVARHFIGKSSTKGSIVVTGSCASVWPSYITPVYTATKHGVLGFMRAVAGHYMHVDGIRINAVLPGTTRTSIIPASNWGRFPAELFTPLELIARLVLMFADGVEIVDTKGFKVPAEKAYGQAVVVAGKNFYLVGEPEYCDDIVAGTMESTKEPLGVLPETLT